MGYEADYAMQAKAMPEDQRSLGQELQELHKLASVHDEMMDRMTSKLEPLLAPPSPHPAPPNITASSPGQSAIRDEVITIQNRWSNQLARLSDLINRIDT